MESPARELDKFPSPWIATIALPDTEVRPEFINSLQLYKGHCTEGKCYFHTETKARVSTN